MAAQTKKRVCAILLYTQSVTGSSAVVNGAAAQTKTGLSATPSSLTTPAAVAALFHASTPMGVAANIEAVSNVLTTGLNRIVMFRLAPTPVADTLSFQLTAGGTYVGSVVDVTAFADAGLTSDSEAAVVSNVLSALATAMA